MHEEVGVPDPPDEINRTRSFGASRSSTGAPAAHSRRARRGPAARARAGRSAIASSSNRPLIDLFLELTGTAGLFRATVSSEEVERGKPAPDVYLEAARRLGVDPTRCAAIEDSENGIRSALRQG